MWGSATCTRRATSAAPDGRDLVVERLLECALVPLLAITYGEPPEPLPLEGDALRGSVHEIEAAASSGS